MKFIDLYEEFVKSVKSDLPNVLPFNVYKLSSNDLSEIKRLSKSLFKDNNYSGWVRGFIIIKDGIIGDLYFWDYDGNTHKDTLSQLGLSYRDGVPIEIVPGVDLINVRTNVYKLNGRYEYVSYGNIAKDIFKKYGIKNIKDQIKLKYGITLKRIIQN